MKFKQQCRADWCCGTGIRTPIFWFRAKRPTIRRSRKIKTVQLNRFYFNKKIRLHQTFKYFRIATQLEKTPKTMPPKV